MLVNGEKLDAVLSRQDVLRAIAVMHVEVKHGSLARAARLGLERGDGDRAEVAEPHRPLLRRVMPGRAQQAEVRRAGLGQLERLERAAGAAQGVVADAFVESRVAVEIVRLGEALEMIFRVRPQHLVDRGRLRLGPVEREIGLRLELLDRAADAERPLRVAGACVRGAALVGDDRHLPRRSFKF